MTGRLRISPLLHERLSGIFRQHGLKALDYMARLAQIVREEHPQATRTEVYQALYGPFVEIFPNDATIEAWERMHPDGGTR